ncbi:MAG: nitroreductase family protein [Lachnospiraceae bacterium]|nr:nitroreductase family protein [Lachnospiraceae bacterium]
MDALECIKTRRSIRKFKEEPVSQETVNAIIEAASYAPSWKNTQISRYHIVENKEILQEIADNCVLDFEFNQKTINRAPQLVVVSMIEKRCGYEKDGSFSTSKEDRWEMFDAGIASQTFCLAAHDMGVGTVILGIFDEEKVAKAISLPEGQKVAALIAMGYPNQECEAPKRKTVEELVNYI